MAAITCSHVRRVFRDHVALDDVTLTVEPHQIFGLLGPNGSGKTTLLNQIQGLDTPTSGSVEVLGLDPLRDHAELVRRLGSQHQESTSLPRLTVSETIRLFAALYPDARDPEELIETLSLTEKADARVESLSGGQRQRVFIPLALIHAPELLIFDELTSALDPHIKHSIWDILRSLRADGRTIVLTTHSMEEAEKLCDRVAILDAGRALAEGSPAELIEKFAPAATVTLSADISLDDDELATIPGVTSIERLDDSLRVTGTGDFAERLAERIITAGDRLTELRIDPPTLEDVFLHLTGRDSATTEEVAS